VLAAAARIGRRELVAPLHLLTAADSRATGPTTWSPWTAALVGTLASRLDEALSPDVDGAGIAARGELVRATALARMQPATPFERSFIARAPLHESRPSSGGKDTAREKPPAARNPGVQ
jgi:UTP:GlnB (protein PII) uridylyltransferase